MSTPLSLPALRQNSEVRGPFAIGLVGILATVAMLFAAFTAALLVRRAGSDWGPVQLPSLVWANTLVILISSVPVELARRAGRRGDARAAAATLTHGTLLGAAFLLGQVLAWQQLAALGYLLPSNPHAAFFYMISAVHGAHVLGGLGALLVTRRRALAGHYSPSHGGITHVAIYWHFVGVLWLYLLILLTTL